MIRAAGGLLWSADSGRRLIAVVHRSRYDDWSLPKGKLNSGESWEQAALREVREETGYRARIAGFAGVAVYSTPKGEKTVRYWNMVREPDPPDGIDTAEVTHVAWLTPEEAAGRLSYASERAILEGWT